jgi:hypothetical protein
MAKDPFKDSADKSGLGRNSDNWSKSIPIYKDPANGRKINSAGDWRPQSEVDPKPVGSEKKNPGSVA